MIRSSGIFKLVDFQFELFKFLLLTAVIIFVYLRMKKLKSLAEILNRIPGPMPNFLIGNLGILGILNSTGNKYLDLEQLLLRMLGLTKLFKNGICRLWIAFFPFIILFKYKTIEAIFNNQSLGEKTVEYSLLEPIMGQGLVTCSFSKNKKRRKLILPALNFKLLDDFLKIFNYHSRITVEKLYQSLDDDFVDVVHLINLCALDIICETAMGVRLTSQREGESDYAKSVNEIDRMVLERGLRPWLWPDFLYYISPQGRRFQKHLEVVSEFTKKVICERKQRFIKEKGDLTNHILNNDVLHCREPMPFMDILLTEHMTNPEFTEKDIKEEVDTFMGAGFDTITMSCSWALFLLGHHPEIQEKVFDELFQIFGNDNERPVTMEDTKQMKYMDCVIKECQRLYPSVSFVGKQISKDIEIEGYKIPKGIGCYILIMALHRDAEVFPNPEIFDPDRFLLENSIGRHPYAYIPFSGGVRSCVGQKYAILEEKTALAHILRNFSLKSLDARDKVMPYPDIVLRTHSQIRVKFTPRFLQ